MIVPAVLLGWNAAKGEAVSICRKEDHATDPFTINRLHDCIVPIHCLDALLPNNGENSSVWAGDNFPRLVVSVYRRYCPSLHIEQRVTDFKRVALTATWRNTVDDENRSVVHPIGLREIAMTQPGGLWIFVEGQFLDKNAFALSEAGWRRNRRDN